MMLRIVGIGVTLLGLATGQAEAQYYPRPDYGYDDGYRRRLPPPGGQCDAFLRTPYGPRRVFCPMGRPKPLGFECACPPPDGYGPTAHGHVVP